MTENHDNVLPFEEGKSDPEKNELVHNSTNNPAADTRLTETLPTSDADNREPQNDVVGKQHELPTDKSNILERLKNLAAGQSVPTRSEVESLKYAFYKLRSAETEAQKAAFVEGGNDANDFVPDNDPAEDVLKTYLAEIKEKRAAQAALEERLKEENYEKRLSIIETLQKLTESTGDFNKLYKEFKDLQQVWNEAKPIPASKEKELWKSYQYYTEIFYDLLKINNEFRDYDFKKNLELKTAICEAAEKLVEESDIISAFYQLQNFHQQWREIGPVARELRDELWNRFKVASTAINKNYQSHFEALKGKENENLENKNAIIEELKKIDYDVLTSMKAWDEKSREVIDLQAKWKTIGFVPRKLNAQVFDEFRKLCDTFFEKKSHFFKEVKDDMEHNLLKRRELVERANAMKNSEDWKKTTDAMINIQKEWKTLGPVPRKYSDAIWKEFVAACDYFFEQKKKKFSSAKDEETVNLCAKKEIIQQINNLDTSLNANEALAKLRELSEQFNNIGFVPFKEKDKIYKEFHKALDEQYDRLKVDRTERRFEEFRSNLEDISKSDNARKLMMRERDKLIHIYTKLKSDLQTYENNMNFLSISSKSAGNLLKEVNHKIEDLKNEMELISKKIKSIEKTINNL